MTEEKKEAVKERQKLTIVSVSSPKPIGDKGASKLEFSAMFNGKGYGYFTFTQGLFEFIKKDALYDADVEISTRETPTATYTDRKVTQLYNDKGEPMLAQKQFNRQRPTADPRVVVLRYEADIVVALINAGIIKNWDEKLNNEMLARAKAAYKELSTW